MEQWIARVDPQRANHHWRRRFSWALFTLGARALMAGDLVLAARCYEYALSLIEAESVRAVHDNRVLGAIYFMLGDQPNASRAFEQAGRWRHLLLAKGGAGSVRQLGPGWLVAIGHVAMIDFYFKMRLLGWLPEVKQVMLAEALPKIPGGIIPLEYRKYGLRIEYNNTEWPKTYDQLKKKDELAWNQLTEEQRFSIKDDFWEYRFPDGKVLPYTHAAARIQQAWEAQGRGPLLELDEQKRSALDCLLDEMRIPRGAWYVCLHVREPGFHAKWNATYPSARDAEIDDYYEAIAAIRERGGWVVRVGDPTMKRFPKMDGVYDYAHSKLKGQIGDIVLPVGCRFFLGTNSGYATVPAIYGVPNVLTNWIPVALPLWFSKDLMIPKMFWNKTEQRYLSFQELFGSKIGAMQNVLDFPADIEVRNNTPEEITAAAIEMLDRCENTAIYMDNDHALQNQYFAIAEKHGSYRGSRIGREFLKKYQSLLQ